MHRGRGVRGEVDARWRQGESPSLLASSEAKLRQGNDKLTIQDPDTLGVLAAAQLDGSVCVYAVPKPGPERVYINAAPMLRIEVDDATAMCLDWISGGRLAVGLSNGELDKCVWS